MRRRSLAGQLTNLSNVSTMNREENSKLVQRTVYTTNRHTQTKMQTVSIFSVSLKNLIITCAVNPAFKRPGKDADAIEGTLIEKGSNITRVAEDPISPQAEANQLILTNSSNAAWSEAPYFKQLGTRQSEVQPSPATQTVSATHPTIAPSGTTLPRKNANDQYVQHANLRDRKSVV